MSSAGPFGVGIAGWAQYRWLFHTRTKPVVNTARGSGSSLTTIPGKPAPTGECVLLGSGRLVGRLAFAVAFDFLAPSRGRVEVLRSG
jgi:hypothetical protein